MRSYELRTEIRTQPELQRSSYWTLTTTLTFLPQDGSSSTLAEAIKTEVVFGGQKSRKYNPTHKPPPDILIKAHMEAV